MKYQWSTSFTKVVVYPVHLVGKSMKIAMYNNISLCLSITHRCLKVKLQKFQFWIGFLLAGRSVYIPANKNPILKLDGNLNFLKTDQKKVRNTPLYWF